MTKTIKIIGRNGGHYESQVFKYILSNIFTDYTINGRFDNRNATKNIYIFGSLSLVPDYKKWQMIWKDNKKDQYVVKLDETFKDDLILFFSGESWDIDYIPYDNNNKCVVCSPYRDDRLNGVFNLPWISIVYISFHLVNYIDKYQKNKDYSKKKHHIAYCVKMRTKDRITFMNSLVKKFEITNRGKEIFSLGPHKIEGTTKGEKIPKYSSPNKSLVDKLNEFKFACVFENRERKGYITEKLLQAFLGNTIPIYQGDHELAKTLFNPNAMICVRDFESYDHCIDHIYNMKEEDIQNMLNEPMFKDNKIPEVFDITNFETGIYGELAEYIRSL